jgi:hypothetical protein
VAYNEKVASLFLLPPALEDGWDEGRSSHKVGLYLAFLYFIYLSIPPFCLYTSFRADADTPLHLSFYMAFRAGFGFRDFAIAPRLTNKPELQR